jgi:hypothetical protein
LLPLLLLLRESIEKRLSFGGRRPKIGERPAERIVKAVGGCRRARRGRGQQQGEDSGQKHGVLIMRSGLRRARATHASGAPRSSLSRPEKTKQKIEQNRIF